ncbi:hypothetical protein RUM43_013778 [Polyplax serrata]|uniref:Uncharacterized protein n=1 Tax=Polyplax serrata TaxID=468196 RepID=A0AAN8NXC0_POLSC
MLHRSKSWPVQSVVTLDPRGIVFASVQPFWEKRTKMSEQIHEKKESKTNSKPDVIKEVNQRRSPLSAQPDIFLRLEKEIFNLGGSIEPVEITFVDHYQVLDGVNPNYEQSFIVPVPLEEPTKWEPGKSPGKVSTTPTGDGSRVTFSSSTVVRNGVNKIGSGNAENGNEKQSGKCKKCKFRETNLQKVNRGKVQEEIGDEIRREELHDVKQLLTDYQIELLRKNCLKSLNRMRSSSIDINCSIDGENGSKKHEKIVERKLTSEFESVASNETKTTDCDGPPRRHVKSGDRRESFHFIRSYSLGHEQTRERPTGTFKKFSLPTPVIQLKEENENPENPQEDKDSALQNLKLDKRKVTTLTRHYYPENGWGYVIVTCSVIVHILCHGLQLSAGVIMIPAALKFSTDLVHTGKTDLLRYFERRPQVYCDQEANRDQDQS